MAQPTVPSYDLNGSGLYSPPVHTHISDLQDGEDPPWARLLDGTWEEDPGPPETHRPATSRTPNTTTYNCTYNGCIQRFSTPNDLQKHVHDFHRPTLTPDAPAAASTRPSWALVPSTEQRILRAPSSDDWARWQPIIESRYKDVTCRMLADEMAGDGLRVTVKMIADRKKKWDINNKNKRKRSGETGVVTEQHRHRHPQLSTPVRPMVPAGHDAEDRTAALTSRMAPIDETADQHAMDHTAQDPRSTPAPPMTLPHLTPSETLPSSVPFDVNSHIPSVLELTTKGKEAASVITQVLAGSEFAISNALALRSLVEALLRAYQSAFEHISCCGDCKSIRADPFDPCAEIQRKLRDFDAVFLEQLNQMVCVRSNFGKFALLNVTFLHWFDVTKYLGADIEELVIRYIAKDFEFAPSKENAIALLKAQPERFESLHSLWISKGHLPHAWHCMTASACRFDSSCCLDPRTCENLRCSCIRRKIFKSSQPMPRHEEHDLTIDESEASC